jgi:thioesterase domain-containing protein/acyl carrier protein
MTEPADSPVKDTPAAEKRARLRQLLARKGREGADMAGEDLSRELRFTGESLGAEAAAGPPPALAAPRRLTLAEQRLWHLDAHAPGVHEFSIGFRLDGPLDEDLLERALYSAAGRHPALRSVIAGDEVMEAGLPEPLLPRRVIAEDQLDQTLRYEAARPIHLQSEPGWRAVLFRLAAERRVLLLHFHHVIADRWSVAVLMADLSAAYRDLAAGRDPDTAQRQDPWTLPGGQADRENQLSHWRRLFETPVPVMPLPLGRGGASGYAGSMLTVDLPASVAESAAQTAERHGSSLFAVLLATLTIFLQRHGGSDDLVVCTPMTGRHRARTRSVVGYLNNIVPLRIRLSGDPSFPDVLARVSAAAREAFAYQDLPFHEIASLQEVRTLRLSRCLFSMQAVPGLCPEFEGVQASHWDVPNGTANFDFALFAEQYGSGLRLLFNYKNEIYTEADIRLLAERFEQLLTLLTAGADTRLPDLPDWAERQSEPAAPGGSVIDPHVAPDSSVLELRMVDLWRDVLGVADLDGNTDFFEAGGDSLKAARLFTRISAAFGVDLPLATLMEASTPMAVASRLADRDWMAPWSSLIPVRITGNRPPLFILHAGGGNVLTYRNLAARLSEDQPVYCLQAKGLRQGDSPLGSVEEMADHYLKAVRAIYPHGPYCLVGYSLGGALAYEMACRLTADGEAVPFLGMLDHPGPAVRLNWTDWLRFNLTNVSMLRPADAARYVVRGLVFKLRRSSARRRTQATSSSGAVDLFEKSIRALEAYQVPPYSGHVTLFRAMQGTARIRADRYGGWGGVALGGVTVIEVPGRHSTMLDVPIVDELARQLDGCLERAAPRAAMPLQ